MTTMRFLGPSFVMEVPSTWMVLSSTRYQVMFLSPPTRDGVHVNLNVILQPLKTDFSTFVAEADAALAQTYPDFELQEAADHTTPDGTPGAYRRATWRNGQTRLLQQQMLFEYDTIAYVVTTLRPLDNPDAAAVDASFDAMLRSFQFTRVSFGDLTAAV